MIIWLNIQSRRKHCVCAYLFCSNTQNGPPAAALRLASPRTIRASHSISVLRRLTGSDTRILPSEVTPRRTMKCPLVVKCSGSMRAIQLAVGKRVDNALPVVDANACDVKPEMPRSVGYQRVIAAVALCYIPVLKRSIRHFFRGYHVAG